MANVTANRALNMLSTNVWYGAVESYDSSHITIKAGARSGTYSGNFTFDAYGRVYGQLSGYEYQFAGQTIFEANGIRANANIVANAVNRGDGDAAVSYCLRNNDRVLGSTSSDTLAGFAGADRILGSAGYDVLLGMSGKDSLFGGKGADDLIGGKGADVLDGGNDINRDSFVFRSRLDSGVGADRDRILNFDRGEDTVDLRGLGLNSSAFGSGPSSRGVWVNEYGNGIVVKIDLNGDARSDFDILVQNVARLNASDFLI